MMFPFLRFVRRFAFPVLVLGILAGCATPDGIKHDSDSVFQRTGRFSVSVKEFSGAQDAVQGGFVWQDSGAALSLDLANPLGSTLARITVDDGMAVLTHSNGSREYAADADGLAEIALGSPVPVSGLRDWLRGETGTAPTDDLQKNDDGTPASFVQDGWRVRLSRYDELGPNLLQMDRRDSRGDISVRLVVSPRASP